MKSFGSVYVLFLKRVERKICTREERREREVLKTAREERNLQSRLEQSSERLQRFDARYSSETNTSSRKSARSKRIYQAPSISFPAFLPRKNHHPAKRFFSAAAQNVVPRKEEHDAKAERCSRCNNRITETLFKRLIQSFLRIHASIFTHFTYIPLLPHTNFLRVKKKSERKI